MKKLILVLVMMTAFAAMAMAEARNPGGPMDSPDEGSTTQGRGINPDIQPVPAGDIVVRPVPEPGTMALASMGLIALGAAARKRREK